MDESPCPRAHAAAHPKRHFPRLLTLAIAVSLAACTAPTDPTPTPTPEATVLRIGVQGGWERLDPRDEQPELQTLMIAMEPLLHLTADRQLHPALATAWSVEDDGLTLRLTLRDDVLFHDGTTFGSDDVRFTLEGRIDDLESVDTPGPLEAVLRFSTPSAAVLYDLPRIPILPDGADTDFAEQPVGTGPYAFAEAVTGTPLTLQRFDGYWGDPGHHDEVHVHLFEFANLDALIDEVIDGGLDLTQIPLSSARVERLRNATGVNLDRIPSLNRQFLVPNTAVAPLDDVRVRVAFDLLMPRDTIVAGFNDEAFEVSTLLGDGTPWSDGAPPRPLDPVQAQALLDDVGPLGRALTLHTNADPDRLSTAAIVRDTLAPYGIEIDVVQIEFGELIDRAGSGDFDLLLIGTLSGSNPVASALWAAEPQPLLPAPVFSTTRIAELTDAVKRQDVSAGVGADDFRELLGLLADEAAYVYTGAPSVYGVLGDAFTGWAPHPDRALSLQNVHRIAVP